MKLNPAEKKLMLTAYDFETAKLLEKASVDFVLVGDSYGMVVLGHKDTKSVTLDMLIEVAKNVRKGASQSFVIFDMPYKSYESPNEALMNARYALDETQCDAVKIEGRPDIVKYLTSNGIKVLGHSGLKPQFEEKLGLKGKQEQEAASIFDEAKLIEQAGAFSIVLECIPEDLARKITETLRIATFGIGSGKFCNGQVRVTNDILSLPGGKNYSFVEKFDDKNKTLADNLKDFIKYIRKF